jgi:hypothetical protein
VFFETDAISLQFTAPYYSSSGIFEGVQVTVENYTTTA